MYICLRITTIVSNKVRMIYVGQISYKSYNQIKSLKTFQPT